MAKIRSPYDEPVIVPWLDDLVVNPGQTVGVPDDLLPNFLAAGWAPADTATKKAAADLTKQTDGSEQGDAETGAGQES